MVSKPAGLNMREWLQPRNYARTEVAVWDGVERRPGPNGGKAEVWWEETGKSTTRAAGVGVQARREGCAEITSGRSAGPAGGGPTCPDSLSERKAQRGEASGRVWLPH